MSTGTPSSRICVYHHRHFGIGDVLNLMRWTVERELPEMTACEGATGA
jgi:hypothetical protein